MDPDQFKEMMKVLKNIDANLQWLRKDTEQHKPVRLSVQSDITGMSMSYRGVSPDVWKGEAP